MNVTFPVALSPPTVATIFPSESLSNVIVGVALGILGRNVCDIAL